MKQLRPLSFFLAMMSGPAWCQAADHDIVLHAARLLDVETGKLLAPGEVLVRGERIAEVGTKVNRSANAEVIDIQPTR